MSKISDVKREADIIKVIEGYGISLQPRGQEMVGLCCFHQDSRPSLNVNRKKQVFYCPVCDTRGDVIDFVQIKEGVQTPLEAAQIIIDKKFTQHVQQEPKKGHKTGAPQNWRQVTPAPLPGQIVHHAHGKPTRQWEYRDSAGALLGFICRFDTNEGKEIVPYTFRQNDTGQKMWMFRGFDRPRPLYNLPEIAKRKTATVVVTEGEKTADATQRLLPKTVATCWQGGARAYTAADWEPLRGRRVLLWPDNDQPGIEAMLAVAAMLKDRGITEDVHIVMPMVEKPKGWDLADAEPDNMNADDVRAYTLANMHKPAAPVWAERLATYSAPNLPQAAPAPDPAPTPAPAIEPRPVPSIAAVRAPDTPGNNSYFEVLGFVKDGARQMFAFYVKAARIVLMYNASALGSKSNLITLAPLDYWEDTYPGKKRGAEFSLDMAMQVLIGIANRRGVFTPRQLRGRGAWQDDGRLVLHLGTHLLVNGHRVELGQINSRYVYEAGEAMDLQATNPLDSKQAVRLLELTRMISWERAINGYLLAGWCVIAPFCGALRWRPHIWITGGAGTGKSWVLREIVRRLLGSACLAVQSETSEAGLRQTLASDAIPVVFDEAEGENRHSLERMEHVLALIRASSTSDGGIVAKGTAFGRGQAFEVRSCFACGSINSPITLQADRTRITNLVIVEKPQNERHQLFAAIQKTYAEVMTDQWVASLQARTLLLLPVILRNADVFASAAAALLGQQRLGDQLGIMLAGAYSLRGGGEITYEAAMEWIQGKDWAEEKVLQDTRDELHLLATMAEKMVRVDGLDGGPVERNLGELVRITAGFEQDTKLTIEGCQARLRRIGFKVDGNHLYISISSEQVRYWLQGTAWAKNFHRTMLRVPGAEMVASVRFASGMQTRAVRVPLTYFK